MIIENLEEKAYYDLFVDKAFVNKLWWAYLENPFGMYMYYGDVKTNISDLIKNGEQVFKSHELKIDNFWFTCYKNLLQYLHETPDNTKP